MTRAEKMTAVERDFPPWRSYPLDGDVTNEHRAGFAQVAVLAFCKETGDVLIEDGPETVLSDLLCDLMHWADKYPPSRGEGGFWGMALARAEGHHKEELAEEAQGCEED